MNNWYVYRHIRKDTNQPFYIGIGSRANYARSRDGIRTRKRNPIWQRIAEKTEFEIDILLEDLSKVEASAKEQEFIKLYGRIDMDGGTLANMTDGGDGVWNSPRSKETKAKLRLARLGAKNPMFGKHPSQETLRKRSASMTGKKFSEERKEMQSITNTQRKPVLVYRHSNREFIGEYRGVAEACRQLGMFKDNPKASIVAHCNTTRVQVKGFVFIFKGDVQRLAEWRLGTILFNGLRTNRTDLFYQQQAFGVKLVNRVSGRRQKITFSRPASRDELPTVEDRKKLLISLTGGNLPIKNRQRYAEWAEKQAKHTFGL